MAQPYLITITFIDEKRRQSRLSFRLSGSVGTAEVNAYTEEFVTKLQPLVLGGFSSINVTTPIAIPIGIRTAPLVTSDVEEKMKITWNTELSKKTDYAIPTFNPSKTADLFRSKERILDLLDDDVEAWYNLIVDADAAGYSLNPVDARGDQIISVKRTRQKFINSKRQT